MKKIILLLSVCVLFSCGNDNPNKLILKGNIDGLKKGIVYLKKVNDSTFTTLDSMMVNGNSNFELQYNIKEPEVLYLFLDKNAKEENSISFFADKGITEINTSLKNFNFDAIIKGSKQQDIVNNYSAMMLKFKNKNLDLIKNKFDAYKENDTALYNTFKKQHERLEKQKYLYTVNFAIANKDSEVAPYLALSELYNVNIKLLDTINNSITPKVKNSLYGKKLQDFINTIKKNDSIK